MATVHATSGTDRRATHVLSGESLVFRIADEIRDVSSDLSRASGGRSAKTLAKADGLRVTLVVMDAGVALDPESVAGGASLQVIEGELSVGTDGGEESLGPGGLIVLPENLHKRVQARERSAFLLTVAWPAGAGAWTQEASSGHL
jgi:quercetin dioxygenase-like cupin family protein